MNEFWLIFGMAVVTFGARYPVLAILSKVNLPQRIFRGLNYVPASVLTAIIVPALLLPNGNFDIRLTNAPLIAGLITILTAWKSKNLLLTILVGMAALWVWRWLLLQF